MDTRGVFRRRWSSFRIKRKRPVFRAALGVMPVPSAPVLSSVVPSPSEIDIAWADADGGTSNIINYEVWRSRNAGGYTLLYTSPDSSVTDTSDVSTVQGDAVSYKVRARNGGGYSAFSNIISTTSQGPDLLPVPVSAFTNSAGTQVTVVFSEDIVGVIANQSYTTGGHAFTSASGNAIGGLHGTSWIYNLDIPFVHGETQTLVYTGSSSKDDTNNLVATFSGLAITNNVPLAKPIINLDASEATIVSTNIAWFASDGVIGYQIQRSLDGVNWGAATVLGNVLSYADTSTVNQTDYYYRVAARDGITVSSYSDIYGPITALGPTGGQLIAPQISFTSTSNPHTITIDLVSPATGGIGTKQYDLFRSTISGFTPSGSPIASNIVSFPYLDTNTLSHEVLYYYKLRATDALNNSVISPQISAGLPYDGGGGGGGSGTAINEDGGIGVTVDGQPSETDILRYVNPDGEGQESLVIVAYLKSEYDSNIRNPRGVSKTNALGRWLGPINLPIGTYYLVADLSGDGYESKITQIDVS